MLRALISLAFVGVVSASPAGLLQSRQNPYVYPPGSDSATVLSCLSLHESCNGTFANNPYSRVPCVMLTTCSQVVQGSVPPPNIPRLPEETFYSMSGGNPYMTQQNYIDAYYGAISETYRGSYPDNVNYIIEQWQAIAAWTGFCNTLNIPYSNFADWLEYSYVPGICPAVASCQPIPAGTVKPCVPQPTTDNGSCEEMVKQCQYWVTNGLFQNEYCVLASFCYASSNTDVLLLDIYPLNIPAPTTSQQARLSEAVFYNMTGGAPTMSQQNAIDAYYGALTGTWIYTSGTFGSYTTMKTINNGPYPTTPQYVTDFWAIISAWTGFCDTREIPYSNLADYLSYAAGGNYNPTC